MVRLAAIILIVLSYGVSLAAAQAVPRETKSNPQSASGLNQQDLQALRDDVEHMKALVQQMESNLAFVDTTQSPLKHQFQLEIDMWRTVIGHMERRLTAAGKEH
jgi:hypothetical protein